MQTVDIDLAARVILENKRAEVGDAPLSPPNGKESEGSDRCGDDDSETDNSKEYVHHGPVRPPSEGDGCRDSGDEGEDDRKHRLPACAFEGIKHARGIE